MSEILVPGPGVYDGLDATRYHADDSLAPELGRSLSSTGARALSNPRLTPAHFEAERENGRPDSKAFDFGHVAHRLVLGAGEEFAVIPVDLLSVDGKATTNKAKAFVADVRANGQTPISQADFDKAVAMIEAIDRHPQAHDILNGDGIPERSLYWVDEWTGVTCRGRIDWWTGPLTWSSDRPTAIDYKTTAQAGGASRFEFERSLAKYRYDQQAEWYVSGAEACGLGRPLFLFMVQEKVPPYLCSLFELDDENMQIAAEMNRIAREQFAEYEASGYWPGYDDGIGVLSLPPWVIRESAWATAGEPA